MNIKNFILQKEDARKIDVEILRLKKIIPQNTNINIKIKFENDYYIASISIYCYERYTKGVGVSEHNPAIAVDTAVDEVIRKVRKIKTNRFEKKGAPVLKNNQKEIIKTDDISMNDFETFGLTSEKITKTKNIDIKPITVEEAIEQMELLEKDFFVFYNLNGEVRVLYKRTKNKGYGILCE